MADDAAIVFTPSGLRGRFPLGTPVLQAARALGVDVDSVCGGRGICGRCQVTQVEGEFAKHGIVSRNNHLSAFSEVEQAYSARKPMEAGRRLSCTAKILGDVVIDVPAESQAHRQIVRKAAEAVAIELDPAIRLHYVEVAEPDMHASASDLRRLTDALEREWGLRSLACDLAVVQSLQVALRKGGWQVTVAVHDEKTIVAVWPGFRDKAFGMSARPRSPRISATSRAARSWPPSAA